MPVYYSDSRLKASRLAKRYKWHNKSCQAPAVASTLLVTCRCIWQAASLTVTSLPRAVSSKSPVLVACLSLQERAVAGGPSVQVCCLPAGSQQL